MIFPVLELERVVQVGDKTRLSGVKSFSAAAETIEGVRIRPEATADFVDVTGFDSRNWFLDWVYQGSSRSAQVTLEISGPSGVQTLDKKLIVLTEADDQLFSTDQDLEALEPTLNKFVPDGRSSFLNVHREAKNKILETLMDRGFTTSGGNPITPAVLLDHDQVRTWSRFLTLSLIFEGMVRTPDDVFSVKAQAYKAQANVRSEQAILALDLNGDGLADPCEGRYETVVTRTLRR